MSKRSEDAAMKAYPIKTVTTYGYTNVVTNKDTNAEKRSVFQFGYEIAEQDLGWHSVDESLPPVDEEVIVLADRLNLGSLFVIAFGHIVDRNLCSDYNGWNIPRVKYWMPMPELPNEEET